MPIVFALANSVVERRSSYHRERRVTQRNTQRLKNSRITDWILLIAISAFFFLWKLSAFGLIGADEPRYAQVAHEMLTRHDWVTPTLGGTAWLEKPPLYYWQAIVAYKLFGVSDWAARLPSVFDAFLLVIAVYLFLRRFRPGLELEGGLIVATMAGVVGFARAGSTDMPLTTMFGIAMLAWYAWFESGEKKYLAASSAFLALATLAKGPVAPLLVILIVGSFAAAQRSPAILWKTFWIPGVLFFLAVALPWYVLVQTRNPQFFHEFIVRHNMARFGTNLYHHPEPFWYYIPVTLLGWTPWLIFAVGGLVQAVREWRTRSADTFSYFLLIWVAVVVIFFSLSQSKLPGYILPALPAGAILAVEFIRKRTVTETKSAWIERVIAALHGVILAGMLFCALVAQNLILRHRVPWGAILVLLAAAIAIAVAVALLLIKSNFPILRTVTLVPLIVALAIAIRLGAQPLDEQLSARPVANELSGFDPHRLPIAVFLVPRETEFGLAFYRNQLINRYELKQIPAGEHLVVAAQGFQRSVAKESGRKPVLLGSFPRQKLEFFYIPKQ